ncbi:hypothetical protein SAMN04487761_10333 [Lachnospiraceae bacterium C7]|nr:hypothetical protein SAMN04487761_10333 [Lachnospiraceae bacterium C7]
MKNRREKVIEMVKHKNILKKVKNIFKKDLKAKGSYTIEAAILVPLLIVVFMTSIKLGITLYQEIESEKEDQKIVNMWEVKDFYFVEAGKSLIDEKNL